LELEFKVDTKERKQWFTSESFAHPAKMSLPLQLWLIEKYTKPGDVILDPMAGIGTILVGATLGRNIICVELEDKFCRMMLNNREKIKQKGPQLDYQMGNCFILWGDARNILPAREHPYQDLWLKYPKLDYATIKSIRRYSKLPLKGNAWNLESLLVDKIITSPPYAENPGTPSLGSVNKDDWGNEGTDIVARRGLEKGYSKDTEGQIGNLPYGQIDKIVTSPPYAEAQSGSGLAKNPPESFRGVLKNFTQKQGDDINNVSNFPYGNIDAVITSPPYENQLKIGREHGGIVGREMANGITSGNLGTPQLYSREPDNIGNLKSQSYLEAMLQVYQQCHNVLKASGLMILVTKNFIRNKQVIRLDLDTIKLCEQAGFKLTEQHKRKLPSQSFWRIIYYQKHPEVEKIDHEDILVFVK